MMRSLLEFIGSLYGDQEEYLVCDNDHRFPFDYHYDCPLCHEELRVHPSNSEMLPLRFQIWRMKWFPYRLYAWRGSGDWRGPGDASYRYWHAPNVLKTQREFFRRKEQNVLDSVE
jgi:hypothetical protein